ncbi:putative RNA polymerase II subunit B1 CTD phosphatase RPAP2 [Arctopsyche grandis]|uniref:putative RNA polymerase II subunit B1 CTD phosphatase RPAP2 n=1 Tax=Arctopsyche grandis TaxID=121162 RepID=UPI00406D6914
MTEDQLKAFSTKKKECDNKAQTIVIELLESPISQTTLLELLPYINQNHYEDITVERAIIKKCGYPLCTKKLPDKLPSRKYKVCTKTNKVYDITTRKNFCSDQCYAASTYLKQQMMTTPLWFREKDDIPKFCLLPLDIKGVKGELIDISITEKIPKDNKKPFASYLDFTQASLNEIDATSDDVQTSEQPKDENTNKQPENTVPESKSSTIPFKEKETTNKPVLSKPSNPTKNFKNTKLLGEVIERQPPKVDPIITAGLSLKMKMSKESDEIAAKKNAETQQKNKEINAGTECSPLVMHIEKSFGEWINLDTLIFILGEIKLKEIVSDKGDEIKARLEGMMSSISSDFKFSDQYQRLCRKLNLLELEDRKYDQKSNDIDLKPLPDYRILQEEGKTLDLKVNAFFKGTMEIPVLKNTEKSKVETEDEEYPNIPPVDKNAQSTLRRKIFLTGLDKVLPDMLKALQLPAREISGDVRQLVATFDLKPHNVMFKNVQWNLIAIVIIKLLSIRNQRLSKHLNGPTSNTHLNLILMSYRQDFGYLDRLIWWLTDIDRVLQTTVDTKH